MSGTGWEGLFNCHPDPDLSVSRFLDSSPFTEFTLSEILRSLRSLRMTIGEAFKVGVTGDEGFRVRMTGRVAKQSRMIYGIGIMVTLHQDAG